MENDSKAVVTVLQKGIEILTHDGLLVEDIRFSLRHFTKSHYSQIKREGNMVAHSLARYALHVSDVVVWMEGIPSNVVSVLQADLAHFY